MQHGFAFLARVSPVLALAAAAACGGDSSGPSTPTVARVTVEPTSATVLVGATTQFSATARDAGGNALSGHAIAWSSSNSQLAAVSANGLVTGIAAGGPVSIIATSEGRSGSAQVTVGATVATVSVTPATSALAPGSTVQLYAITKDDQGHALTGRTIGWKSGAEPVAIVSASGLVTGVAPGAPVTITATSEGKSGSALVTVLGPVAEVTVAPDSLRIPAGVEVQLTVALRDAYGNVLIHPAVTWSSSDPSVATVTPAGLLQALAAGGPVTITATSGGVSAGARVTVLPVLPVSFASGTAVLSGKLYQQGDGTVHPTVVLLSAYSRAAAENADIAAGVQAEGWNALVFDFSGTWGSTGEYSFDNALVDAGNVVAILRSTAGESWGVAGDRIVLVGRGEGGWLVLMAAARDDAIACVGALSPIDVGILGGMMAEDPTLREGLITETRVLAEETSMRLAMTPEAIVDDMIARADSLGLGPLAPRLASRPLLLVGAGLDQSYPYYEQARLVDALTAAGATKLTTAMIDDNHRFMGSRPALVQQVRDWLHNGCGY